MMLNIKRKFVTVALMLVLVAPMIRSPQAMLDFGNGVTQMGCVGSGGC